jgi:hypothetical protein
MASRQCDAPSVRRCPSPEPEGSRIPGSTTADEYFVPRVLGSKRVLAAAPLA